MRSFFNLEKPLYIKIASIINFIEAVYYLEKKKITFPLPHYLSLYDPDKDYSQKVY
ncbi:hypothetical protein HNR74_004131 [Flammeovirga kamogawensis]|nr:hypothetical protein [Flammeovirga kamogawensis]